MSNSKNWWFPVWSGLILDGKHIERMGKAMPLYLYFLCYANRDNGALVRKYETISREINVPVQSLKRWMGILKKYGYVKLTRLPHGFRVKITKWKPISKQNRSTKNGTTGSFKNGVVKFHFWVSEVPLLIRRPENRGSLNGQKQREYRDTSSKNGTSKESIKEINICPEPKKQGPGHTHKSQNSCPKKPKSPARGKNKKPTNPDIKILVDHYHDEFLRVLGIKPEINGAHGKVFQDQLEKQGRDVESIKKLITGYLSIDDQGLLKKGYPIAWFSNHVNELLILEKEHAGTVQTPEERQERERRIQAARAKRDQQADEFLNSVTA